jgi:hypothetical protein
MTQTAQNINIQYKEIVKLKKEKTKFILIWSLVGFFGGHRFMVNKKKSAYFILFLSLFSFVVFFTSIFTLTSFFNFYTISSLLSMLFLLILSIIDLAVYLKLSEDKQKTIMEKI